MQHSGLVLRKIGARGDLSEEQSALAISCFRVIQVAGAAEKTKEKLHLAHSCRG